MKTHQCYLSLILSIFLFTTMTQAQWYEITNIPPGWGAVKLDAFDSLIAIGPVGQGVLYITEDGGNNWSASTLPSYIFTTEIIGSEKIWLTNFEEIWASKDGGVNWELQFYDLTLTQFLNYIEMFDSLNGVAMGDAPTPNDPALFLRTTDGGENWISMNHSNLIGLWSGDTWRRVDFVDINVGYFYSYGEIPEKLYKTTNGGTDWIELNDSLECTMVKFYNEDIGIVFGGECGALVCDLNVSITKDGGQSWEFGNIDSIGFAMDIEFIPGNPSDVWLLAGNKAFFSNDTGRTWTEELHIPILQPAYGFRDMVFTDKNHGWIVGREPISQGFTHHLYRTTNGGFGGLVSVEDDKVETVPIGYYLYQNFPNPFNPITTIKYQIPKGSFVTIKIYDVLGNEMQTLVSEEKLAGSYKVDWDISTFGGVISSGIYFYKLNAGVFVETKKMVLIK